MEADMQLVFMKKVREQEARLKRSEEELYARHREIQEVLDSQLRALQERKRILENDSGVSLVGSCTLPYAEYIIVTSRA
jgi:SMC interacting uncharacterized protein involved in chromosome segregation